MCFSPCLVGFLWFSGFMALSVSARFQGLSSTVAYGIDSGSASRSGWSNGLHPYHCVASRVCRLCPSEPLM